MTPFAVGGAVAAQLTGYPAGQVLQRGQLTEAVPNAVGALMIVFLAVAVGFVIAAYAEATARRIRPRQVIMTKERPDHQLPEAVVPLFLLALLVGIALLMGRGL